jgi:hypothetical protein
MGAQASACATPSAIEQKIVRFRPDAASGTCYKTGFLQGFFSSIKYLDILADCPWRSRDSHILPGDLELEH